LVRDPDVGVLFTVKGVTEMHEFDQAAVAEKYGIPPELYPEFATLRGDPSDGLPGVAGIGPVRAVKLLTEFGNIDGIMTHLEELPPKQSAAFEAARSYLEAMKTVVRLPRDAPIEQTSPHPPDEARVKELVEVHGLGSSGARLVRALKATGGSDH
jgi:5'-3' exonuclease